MKRNARNILVALRDSPVPLHVYDVAARVSRPVADVSLDLARALSRGRHALVARDAAARWTLTDRGRAAACKET